MLFINNWITWPRLAVWVVHLSSGGVHSTTPSHIFFRARLSTSGYVRDCPSTLEMATEHSSVRRQSISIRNCIPPSTPLGSQSHRHDQYGQCGDGLSSRSRPPMSMMDIEVDECLYVPLLKSTREDNRGIGVNIDCDEFSTNTFKAHSVVPQRPQICRLLSTCNQIPLGNQSLLHDHWTALFSNLPVTTIGLLVLTVS